MESYHIDHCTQDSTSLKGADDAAHGICVRAAEVVLKSVESDRRADDAGVIAKQESTYSQKDCRYDGDGISARHDGQFRGFACRSVSLQKVDDLCVVLSSDSSVLSEAARVKSVVHDKDGDAGSLYTQVGTNERRPCARLEDEVSFESRRIMRATE